MEILVEGRVRPAAEVAWALALDDVVSSTEELDETPAGVAEEPVPHVILSFALRSCEAEHSGFISWHVVVLGAAATHAAISTALSGSSVEAVVWTDLPD
jgi:hypothetical protein